MKLLLIVGGLDRCSRRPCPRRRLDATGEAPGFAVGNLPGDGGSGVVPHHRRRRLSLVARRREERHATRRPRRPHGLGRRRQQRENDDGSRAYRKPRASSCRASRILTCPLAAPGPIVIVPAPNGTTLTITEDGEVYNPIFRFMSRFVFGHEATMATYLSAAQKKLNLTETAVTASREPPTPSAKVSHGLRRELHTQTCWQVQPRDGFAGTERAPVSRTDAARDPARRDHERNSKRWGSARRVRRAVRRVCDRGRR